MEVAADTQVLGSILNEIGAAEYLQVFIGDDQDDDALKTMSKIKPARIAAKYGLSLDQAAAFAEKCRSVCSRLGSLPHPNVVPEVASDSGAFASQDGVEASHKRFDDKLYRLPYSSPTAPRDPSPAPPALLVPIADDVQSSGASVSDHAHFQKLFDAAVSSLRLKDKQFMGEVFNRHAKPIGLSAKAFMLALHAIRQPTDVPLHSDADASKKLKEIFFTSHKGHVNFKEFCEATKEFFDPASKSSPAMLFKRFADITGLSTKALIDALTEVDAPVLSSCEGSSPQQIFRRADANMSGSVDLAGFMRAAQLPDDLERILEDHRLGVLAPALRALLSGGEDQVKRFAKLKPKDLFVAVKASVESLKQQLDNVRSLVEKAIDSEVQLQEAMDKDPTNKKFTTFKAAGGCIDDFFKGLEDRIGAPNLDFKKAMCAEHTIREGCAYTFTTGNYQITTQPFKEWSYVVCDDSGHRAECADMSHGREITPIDELMKRPLACQAKLTEEEMIAVVLYTGPMFVIYNAILRRFPTDIYNFFETADNTFSTTIFVLVSAVQKLSRCMNIPAGSLLYRGLGGSMELPDTFFVPAEFCVPSSSCMTPNALGYTEFAFMSTTQDRSVALQYSGVRDNKPKASIMEIHPNSVDRGADISDFSQYPGEREFLIVPCSFVQCDGRQRTEIADGGGVLTVISVSVHINLKTETVEQLRDKKKNMHISAFKSVISETKQWMLAFAEEEGRAQARASTDMQYGKFGYHTVSKLISKTLEQMKSIMDADSKLPVYEYVDDLKYKALVSRMLDAQDWSKQKLRLWIENQETCIMGVMDCTLKDAHRRWLSYLKQRRHSAAIAGSDQCKTAAMEILQCKGLMVTDNACTEESEGEPLLYVAAADGWAIDDMKLVIDAGASLAAVNKNRDSALHAASKNGDLPALKALIEAGASVDQRNEYGWAPICMAASGGHLSCLELLVTKNAGVNVQDAGTDLIKLAASGGHLSCLEFLVSKNLDVNVIDHASGGTAPIHRAAWAGHFSCLEFLVAKKADVNFQDVTGEAPIHLSATIGHLSCLEFLVSKNADVNDRIKKTWKTPVYLAAEGGHFSCLEFLVAKNADVNVICNCNRAAPIHEATEGGHFSCLELLVSKNADVNIRNGSEMGPIYSAVKGGHLSCLELLVSKNADINAQTRNGLAPIHWAAQNGHLSCLEFLVAKNADINVKTFTYGNAPIHDAAERGHLSCLEFLVSQKADINVQDQAGTAPIQMARAGGHSSCVKFLMAAGASVFHA
jgi:ankyrin repeat protein